MQRTARTGITEPPYRVPAIFSLRDYLLDEEILETRIQKLETALKRSRDSAALGNFKMLNKFINELEYLLRTDGISKNLKGGYHAQWSIVTKGYSCLSQACGFRATSPREKKPQDAFNAKVFGFVHDILLEICSGAISNIDKKLVEIGARYNREDEAKAAIKAGKPGKHRLFFAVGFTTAIAHERFSAQKQLELFG